MWLVNIWKLPISDIGCHRGDGRHNHYCHRGRQHCRNNSKLCINFKTGFGQKHISEKIWYWCKSSTLGFFHPQQHCKRRKQIFMRMLHQPLIGIILELGHVYAVHTTYMSVLRQNCTDICFESWWWGSWHPHLRNLSTQAGRHTHKPTNGTAAIVKHYMRCTLYTLHKYHEIPSWWIGQHSQAVAFDFFK